MSVLTAKINMSRAPSATKKPAAETAKPASQHKAKIHIIYYSIYGHIGTLAKSVKKGVEAAGADAHLIQVPETLSEEILAKMHAPDKDASIPTISHSGEGKNAISLESAFTDCDGIIFGYPTRFGGMPAQVKALLDSTGGLWMKGSLVGKPFSTFFSTGTQGSGQETTSLVSLTNFVHHGMIFVPIGYSTPLLANLDEIHGGSPYGAGTIAGSDGSRQPSQLELQIAEHQGKHFATTATALKIGRATVAAATVERPASSKPERVLSAKPN